MIHYDYICLVSNDLEHDRRMIRLCKLLHAKGKEVLLVGRLLPSSNNDLSFDFDIKRLECRFLSGPLFYFELVIKMNRFIGKLKYEHLICCLLYTSPSPRDLSTSRMPSSA